MPALKEARFLGILLLLAVLIVPRQAGFAQPAAVQISAPSAGEALQGVVAVSGSTAVSGFRTAEIAFAYQSDPTGTWFLIQQSSMPVSGGVLTSWDTTTITDGVYKLRVQVFLDDGQVVEQVVNGLRVRNYTAVETSTPAAAIVGPAQPTLTPSLLSDYQVSTVTPVPLPTNPAQLAAVHIQHSAIQGAGIVVALAVLAGLYIGSRSIIRR